MHVEYKDIVELARVLCGLDSDITIPEEHYMILARRALQAGYTRGKEVGNEQTKNGNM